MDDGSEPAAQRPVTSKDVARAAGVSQTTVSLVVAGRSGGRVSARTRERVERTARELGYVPNASARMLRGGRPQLIALAVPNVRHEYFGRVLQAAETTAREQGLGVVLVDTDSDPEWVDRIELMTTTNRLAGAIVYAESPAVTERLARASERIVFVESAAPAGRTSIELDIADGLRQVVEHLVGLGHTRIAHAQAGIARATFDLRAAGLERELAAHGVSFDPARRFTSGFTLEESTDRAEAFLQDTDASAVFCDDDIFAAGLYRAARRLGRSIPGELSVVGFNDIDLAGYLAPELTTLAIPARELGAAAVRSLLQILDGDAPAATTLALTLVVRESTAAAA